MMIGNVSAWQAAPASMVAAPGRLDLWRLELEQPSATVEHYLGLLSADERGRAQAFRFERDRQRFVLARGALRLILSRYLGVSPQQLVFAYSPYGKPELGGELAQHPLRFNLAHSGARALYALAPSQRLGVDVEQKRAIPELESLAKSFFAPAEQAALLALPAEQRQEAFFRCWTRKEAYIKALGLGLSQPLDSFAVSLVHGEPAKLLWLDGQPGAHERWTLLDLADEPEYAAAVAVEGQPSELRFLRVES